MLISIALSELTLCHAFATVNQVQHLQPPACHRWKICFNRSSICISNWGPRVPQAPHLLWKICPHLPQKPSMWPSQTPSFIDGLKAESVVTADRFLFFSRLDWAISKCYQTSSLSISSSIFCSTFLVCAALNNSGAETLLYERHYFVVLSCCSSLIIDKEGKKYGSD